MPAYVLIFREGRIQDAAAYDEYRRLNKENPAPVRGRPRVVYGAIHQLEGQAPDGVVVMEFDDVEQARAWYESPQYQEALQHRVKSGNWRAMILEGM